MLKKQQCHLTWMNNNLPFWVHRVCDLAPPHWSLRAVYNWNEWIGIIFLFVFEFCSWNTFFTHTNIFFFTHPNNTHTHKNVHFYSVSWILGHTFVIIDLRFVPYCMLERRLQNTFWRRRKNESPTKHTPRTPGIHPSGYRCIELTPIQYALVHNSVVSMYKYMFINVPNLWLSFLIQFHFVKKESLRKERWWCNDDVPYVTERWW
jgi:hypothetical protein